MRKWVTFTCAGCGKTRKQWREMGRSAYFCDKNCYAAARRSGAYTQRYKTNKPGTLSHETVKIRVIEDLALFDEFEPEKGKIYDAERYNGPGAIGYVIEVNGHRVNIRWNECEEM